MLSSHEMSLKYRARLLSPLRQAPEPSHRVPLGADLVRG